MLTGPMVVARDIAHAKLKERLDAGDGMPQYMQDYCVYYAGPAKTPEGMASGSFGPTTAGRMDSYVAEFQAAGGSMVMLAKGNRSRSRSPTRARRTAGSTSARSAGPAARLAQDCITKVEVLEYPELGMEAVWKIEVQDFPAFIVVDDKGNDFFDLVNKPYTRPPRPVTPSQRRRDASNPNRSHADHRNGGGRCLVQSNGLAHASYGGEVGGEGAEAEFAFVVWPPWSRKRCIASTVDRCPSVRVEGCALGQQVGLDLLLAAQDRGLGRGDGVRRERRRCARQPVDERPQLVGWQGAVDPSPAPRRSPRRCRRSRGRPRAHETGRSIGSACTVPLPPGRMPRATSGWLNGTGRTAPAAAKRMSQLQRQLAAASADASLDDRDRGLRHGAEAPRTSDGTRSARWALGRSAGIVWMTDTSKWAMKNSGSADRSTTTAHVIVDGERGGQSRTSRHRAAGRTG